MSWYACYKKGWSLRYLPGQGNPHRLVGRCTVMLYVGEGDREGTMALLSLPEFSHFPHYPQANLAFLVLIPPGGWVCVPSRPLRVSPTSFPVRLGVSPAAASTPTGVFNQRFEALFPHAGTLGSDLHPRVLQLQPCLPHSTFHCLTGSASHHLAASPLCRAACVCPSY